MKTVSESLTVSFVSVALLVSPTAGLHHLGLPTEQGQHSLRGRRVWLGGHEVGGRFPEWAVTVVLG